MLDGLAAYTGLGMCQAAELIGVLLEEIGIDGTDPQPQSLCIVSCGLPVIRLIPGNVQRDSRTCPGEPVDDGGVLQLLVQITRRSRPGEDFKACAGIAVTPGWRFDGKGLNAQHNIIDVLLLLFQCRA